MIRALVLLISLIWPLILLYGAITAHSLPTTLLISGAIAWICAQQYS
jgi:hypothetical protein